MAWTRPVRRPQTAHDARDRAGDIDDLFDGFSREVRDSGGLDPDILRDIAWYDRGLVAAADIPLSGLFANLSRFERIARKRALEHRDIHVRGGCHFVGDTHEPSPSRVSGVGFRDEDRTGTTLSATLTVDASGRARSRVDGKGHRICETGDPAPP